MSVLDDLSINISRPQVTDHVWMHVHAPGLTSSFRLTNTEARDLARRLSEAAEAPSSEEHRHF